MAYNKAEDWITPSALFVDSAISGETTKALYIADENNTTFDAVNCSGHTITIPLGGEFFPLCVTSNAAATGYTTIFIY